jgi:hypothetical protein
VSDPRLVAMVNLIGLTGDQECPQRTTGPIGRQFADLFLIMMVNECLDGIDCRVDRIRPERGRQRASQPARHTPYRQQRTPLVGRQQRIETRKMLALGCQMALRELPDLRIAGKRQYTEVDRDSTGLTRMIGTQIAHETGYVTRNPRDRSSVKIDPGAMVNSIAHTLQIVPLRLCAIRPPVSDRARQHRPHPIPCGPRRHALANVSAMIVDATPAFTLRSLKMMSSPMCYEKYLHKRWLTIRCE